MGYPPHYLEPPHFFECFWMFWYIYQLVGGLEHFFFHILGIIIPTDSYFSEGLKPSTSQHCDCVWSMKRMKLWMTSTFSDILGDVVHRIANKIARFVFVQVKTADMFCIYKYICIVMYIIIQYFRNIIIIYNLSTVINPHEPLRIYIYLPYDHS